MERRYHSVSLNSRVRCVCSKSKNEHELDLELASNLALMFWKVESSASGDTDAAAPIMNFGTMEPRKNAQGFGDLDSFSLGLWA